jgi:hypothetical protein
MEIMDIFGAQLVSRRLNGLWGPARSSRDEKPNVSADQGGYRDVVVIYNSYLDWFTSTVIGAMYVGLSLRNQREHYRRLPLSALAFYCQSRG